MAEKFLVTGASGFIGSHVVQRLLASGAEVVGFDRQLPNSLQWEFHQGEICDGDALNGAMWGVTRVIHLAGLVSVPKSWEAPVKFHWVNAIGTLTALQAAAKHGVKSFVLASSSTVYGNPPVGRVPWHELLPDDPQSPYAVSKMTAERFCRIFSQKNELETISLRYFNVYGPGAKHHVVERFMNRLMLGEPIVMDGGGLQTRDFVYVEDVVEATIRAASGVQTIAYNPHGWGINVGTGNATSLTELVNCLSGILGKTSDFEFGPPRPNDVQHCCADTKRCERLLGISSWTPLREGLEKTIETTRVTANIA